MSEGSAVPYVSRWAVTALDAAAGLSNVRVTYRPFNLEDYIADDGNIEAVYWADWDGDVEVRALKGTSNIKYREQASRSLIVLVAFATLTDSDQTTPEDSAGAKCEERAANILGEVVKVFQEAQPSSPGSHLSSISCYVEGWSGTVGILPRGGVDLPAASFEIAVHISANVEQ